MILARILEIQNFTGENGAIISIFLNDRFLTEDFEMRTLLNYQSGLRDTGILVAVGNVVGSSKINFIWSSSLNQVISTCKLYLKQL